MVTCSELKTEITNLLRTKGNGVSFANLAEIPGFSGDAAMEVDNNNIFIWFHCSEQAIQAIKELLNEKQIELHSTSHLTYHIDGSIPRYPIAKSDRVYKSPRWQPMALKKGKTFK
jgi:hypothetical protein